MGHLLLGLKWVVLCVIFCCSWGNKLFMLASNRTSDDLLNNIFKKSFLVG
jgi:hypothetical protein